MDTKSVRRNAKKLNRNSRTSLNACGGFCLFINQIRDFFADKNFQKIAKVSLFAVLAISGIVLAYYTDIEKSLQNIFEAGEINLQIENTSWFNGTSSATTTWPVKDMAAEKYFDFTNLKPGDFGEDTIGITTTSNPAWLCANITLLESNDNGITQPESKYDTTDGKWEGELDDDMDAIVWADDGDNVLEKDETILFHARPSALPQTDNNPGKNFRLADASGSIFGNESGKQGIQPGITYHIAKAWCIGNLTPDPVAQSEDNSPDINPGVKCDGTTLNNRTQSDSLKANIKFWAVQTRHNENYICEDSQRTYITCDTADYSCKPTKEYRTKNECQIDTGKTCYEQNEDCLQDCKRPPQDYFVCNPCAGSCSKTASYASKEACETSENKICYADQGECDTKCGKPADECATKFTCVPKTEDGITVEQLTKHKNCDGTYSYIFKVTNNNKNGLSHFAVELPCGITPVWPANGAIYKYSTSSIHTYTVENPTKDPQGLNEWSIKFNENGEGIKSGASDIFEFRVNQYINDVAIDTQTKWATNRADFTFNCSGTDCPECHKYLACNSDCYTCDQTTNSYLSLDECKQKSGGTCYSATSTCEANCAPIINKTGNTSAQCTDGSSIVQRWAIQARRGDMTGGGINGHTSNNYNEARILFGTNEAAGMHFPWTAYNWYNFKIEHDGNNKVTFTLNGNKQIYYQPIARNSTSLTLLATAPDCAGAAAEIDDYKKDVCEDSIHIGASVLADNSLPDCTTESRSVTISGAGMDLTKPYSITGRLKLWWNSSHDDGPDLPQVKIIFN